MLSSFDLRGEFPRLVVLLWVLLGGMGPLWGQPRAVQISHGWHRPIALLPLKSGQVLVLEESGALYRLPSQGQRPTEPVFRVETVVENPRLISALVMREEGDSIEVALYGVNASDDTPSRAWLGLLRLRLEGNEAMGDFHLLLDFLSGGNSRLGGGMALGPEGALYLGTGVGDDPNLAQDQVSLAGKVLRVSLEGGTQTAVWAWGFHSLRGLAFLPGTDRLYGVDKGPRPPLGRNWDEVNFIQPGQNYGFPLAFGGRAPAPMRVPIAHSTGVRLWDPGGLVAVPAGPWAGSLVWTGLDSQALYRITVDRQDPTKVTFFEELFTRRFGRLRAIAAVSGGDVVVATFDSDALSPNRDRILRISPR